MRYGLFRPNSLSNWGKYGVRAVCSVFYVKTMQFLMEERGNPVWLLGCSLVLSFKKYIIYPREKNDYAAAAVHKHVQNHFSCVEKGQKKKCAYPPLYNLARPNLLLVF